MTDIADWAASDDPALVRVTLGDYEVTNLDRLMDVQIMASIASPMTTCTVTLVNEDGSLDGWVDDFWPVRAFEVWIGNVDGTLTQSLMTGRCAEIKSASRDRIVIEGRDQRERLNADLQTNLLGTGPRKGQPIPLVVGKVRNITPVLIDEQTLTYQVHDGAVTEILNVFEGGAPTDFTADLGAGTFTLHANPQYPITADVRNVEGLDDQYAGGVVKWLILRVWPDALIGDTFVDFAAGLGICRYWAERVNAITAIQEVLDSVGGFLYQDRDGVFQLGRIEDGEGADLQFGPDDTVLGSLRLVKMEPPITGVRLGCKRNWTPMAEDALVGAIETRDMFKEDFWSICTVVSPLESLLPPGAPALVPTLLDGPYPDEAQRRMQLYGGALARQVFRVELCAGIGQAELGDRVLLVNQRYGFATGNVGIVIAYEEYPLTKRVILDLFVHAAGAGAGAVDYSDLEPVYAGAMPSLGDMFIPVGPEEGSQNINWDGTRWVTDSGKSYARLAFGSWVAGFRPAHIILGLSVVGVLAPTTGGSIEISDGSGELLASWDASEFTEDSTFVLDLPLAWADSDLLDIFIFLPLYDGGTIMQVHSVTFS